MPSRLMGPDLQELWNDLEPKFKIRNNRVAACREMQAGRQLVPLPDTYDDEAASALVVQLPQRKLLPLNLTNVLRRRRPTIRREAISTGVRAQKAADDLETWVNAACLQAIDWGALIGRLIQDGECAVLALPNAVDWQRTPSYMDDSGIPISKYDRDSRDRTPGEAGYSRRNERRSRAAFDAEMNAYRASRFPLQARIISATDCLPILGPGMKTEGLLIRTLYTRQQLIARKYRWMEEDRLLQPQANMVGGGSGGYGSQVYLYELFALDDEGEPYVSYCVNGRETSYDGGDPVLDLADEYGLHKLPCQYVYGQHFETDVWDERGVPLLDPLAPAILNAEALLTSVLVHARRMAFPPYVMEIDPSAPPETYLEGEKLREIELPSGGGIVTVGGKVTPLVPPSTGQDVKYLVSELLQAVQGSSPDEAVFGGGGSQSGHQLTLSREYLESANHMVLDGALKAYEFLAESLLELAVSIGRKYKSRVPVYANVKTPVTEGGQRSAQRQVIELHEDWVGDVCDLTAEYPKEGADLASVQQRADLVQRGLALPDEVRELLGDPSPVTTLARIAAWQLMTQTDQGKADLLALAQRLRGEAEQQATQDLQQQGKLTPQGMPTAALAEPFQAEQPGSPMQGMQVPNLAASSLGGVVAGAMQSGPLAAESAARAGMGA